jgi:uncharacterized protein YbaP (TraB family)
MRPLPGMVAEFYPSVRIERGAALHDQQRRPRGDHFSVVAVGTGTFWG